MVSPPKPWERAGTTLAAATTASPTVPSAAPSATMTTAAVNSDTAPALPPRPSTISSSTTLQNGAYSSPYSSYGYNRLGSNYGSPYGSSMYGGGYGGGMYGGGYGGGMYGGMGYGGYGGYGMGPMGAMGAMDPNNPSLTQSLEASTAQTFAVLQSIVQTFGGFAQMLESTFMATHSSFFAMVGVAEQLGNLRNALGTVLGLFGLVRWLKDTVIGNREAQTPLGREFNEFISHPPGSPLPPNAPRLSRKPIMIFLLAMFGIPYLMHRLIRALRARLPPPQNPLDPNNLQFARAIYPFTSNEPPELNMSKGDIIAILQTTDPLTGMEAEWWRGRNRSGREGWFPKSYVEIVKRPGQDVKIEPVKTVD